MLKIFCDRCKKEINGEYRTIEVGDKNREIVLRHGVEADPETTMTSKEICIDCAKTIIAAFRK